jgi:outer membrane protein assembly factor BamB
MDFGFQGFEASGFDVDIEEVEVKRVKRFERLWRIGEGGSVSYTRIHEGVIYFGAADNYFYAVDAETGKELWRFKTGGIITGRAEIFDEMVFFTSFDQNCYALNRKTGSEIWRFRANNEIFEGPVHGDGLLVFGTKGGHIHAIDAKSGKEKWTFKTGDDILAGATIHDGRVFIGSCDKNFYCIDVHTGKEIWRFKTGDLIHSDMPSPILGNMIFIGSFDCNLYCLDYRSGREVWRFRTGKYGISEPPLLYKNVLYLGTRDGILFSISLEGKELWRYKAGGLITKPMAFNDRLYFGSEDGYFRCMDVKGNEIWRFNTEGKMWDIPSYWNGRIIFGTWSCNVHNLDAETGEEFWRFTTSNITPSSLLPPYEAFSTEIKRETRMEEFTGESKYKEKKEETVSLSDYHVESEYSSESEYKQKSDYDTSFVIFEGVMEGEELWTSLLEKKAILTSV